MKYFNNIHTLDELKKEYRRLAMLHHPDKGGDNETMKEINAEYNLLFPGLRAVYNAAAEQPTNETAESTRNEFYTANGWKGENYTSTIPLKEIAQVVRSYIKKKYPTYKFSVRTFYASMCQELHVDLKESPVEIYKTFEELTKDDKDNLIRKMIRNNIFSLSSWNDSELKAEFERVWSEHGNFYRCMNEKTSAVVREVDAFVNSYNYSDCEGMIDYFDVNFYYFGCCPNNGVDVKIVPQTPRREQNKAKKEAGQKTLGNLQVKINDDFNGIEAYFPCKPSAETRTELKKYGWRWHNKKQCWYTRNTEENLQRLKLIAG